MLRWPLPSRHKVLISVHNAWLNLFLITKISHVTCRNQHQLRCSTDLRRTDNTRRSIRNLPVCYRNLFHLLCWRLDALLGNICSLLVTLYIFVLNLWNWLRYRRPRVISSTWFGISGLPSFLSSPLATPLHPNTFIRADHSGTCGHSCRSFLFSRSSDGRPSLC